MLVSRVAPSLARLGPLAVIPSTRLAAIAGIRSQSTSCSNPGVYELRTYNLAAKQFGEFLKLTSEKFDLRTAHSEPVGYWTTEIGGLNQVVHIWYYASLEQRGNIRQALSQDSDWCDQYLSKILPALQQQNNSLLVLLPEVPVVTSNSNTGVYELHEVDMMVPFAEWLPALLEYTQTPSAGGSCLLGAWRTVLGRLDRAVLLYQHSSMDHVVSVDADLERKRANLARFARQWNTKLLKPHSVSPLQ